MKPPTFLSLVALLAFAVPSAGAADLPHVQPLATGGTISGGQQSLDAAGLAALVPAVSQIAKVTLEDVTRVGSSRMMPELQFRLALCVNELFAADPQLAGIVITHGTDTLEETAFLLELVVTADRPVVFAAAPRPPRETDTDGPRNLLNAFRIAASPGARGLGVLVTLNDEIHSARYVRKTHAIAVDAFQSPWVGPLGGGEDLDGLKARILLVVAIGAGANTATIQHWVDRLGGRIPRARCENRDLVRSVRLQPDRDLVRGLRLHPDRDGPPKGGHYVHS